MVADVVTRAEQLRRLHTEPAILVLVHAWDAASARTVAAVPGCRAIGTTPWALPSLRAVAEAVDLPVTADLTGSCGPTATDVAETVAHAVAAGAVGCTLEDGFDASGSLLDAEVAAARLVSAREGAAREGVPIVLTARTDVYLRGDGDLEAAVLRGRAYAAAGADCIFVPGVRDAEAIRSLVDEVGAPVAVLAVPGAPSVRELQELGVAAVFFGPAPMGVALAALARAASDQDAAWRGAEAPRHAWDGEELPSASAEGQ